MRRLLVVVAVSTAAAFLLTIPAQAGDSGFDVSGAPNSPDSTAPPSGQTVVGWTAGASPSSIIGDGGGGIGRTSIADYAKAYVGTVNTDSSTGYNTSYLHFGQDCQNFVSQALKAGGWINQNVSLGPSDPQAWYYVPNAPAAPYYSYTWTVASQFEHHIAVTGRRVYVRYWNQIQLGDVVLVDWNGPDASGRLHVDHSMIVTYRALPNDLYLTYHTTNRLNKSLRALQSVNGNARWWIISAA